MIENQKGIASFVFIMIIVVLIGMVVYLVLQNNKSGQENESTRKIVVTSEETATTPRSFVSSPTLAPSPTGDTTTNWQTYTNDEFKFSIEYPPTWELVQNPKVTIYQANIASLTNSSVGSIKINYQPLAGGIGNPDVRFEYVTAVINGKEVKLQNYYYKNQLKQKNYETEIDGNTLSILLMPNSNSGFESLDQILATFEFTN